ncbi:barstar family protein [Aliikangiella coralliicola]|uniref:Uncharacterized protein n=1 Tax=Aliikangiella coralliicola TaxID=2592383 RepID=A0A545UFL8_9GAMM|nr:barstar family protein [Aliikangiella coralliicola]TQV88272.1 hypothetical protein FLL46_07020 [Aliikangiella coralliicola]
MKPTWSKLNHHEKYLQLHKNRILFCSNDRATKKEQTGKEFFLDGLYIEDIPSFYLSLGEAINGENGYFGTCLDSLNDCIGGGFGVTRPFEVHIINGEGVEKSLNDVAWARMCFENKLRCFDDVDCTYDDLIEIGVFDEMDLKGASYFKAIERVFNDSNVPIKLYD